MKRHSLATFAVTATLLGAVAVPASSARPAHHTTTHTFSFLARVVKSGPTGLLVSAPSGKRLWFPASQIAHRSTTSGKHGSSTHHSRPHHGARADATESTQTQTSPSVTINIIGLQPGVTVLITETVAANGDVTITITLPPPSTTGEQTVSGTVTEVDDADFIVDPGNGADLQLNMDADTLSNLNLSECDLVSVSYHQDAGLLIADSVAITGSSTTGDCTPTSDVTGTITQVSGTAVAIESDAGPMSFVVDSSDVTDGYSVGDLVDVTYTQETDGTLDASDVEYVEGDTTGIVTAVTATRVTITDSQTTQPDTFIADPAGGLQVTSDAFTGIAIGDNIEVCFHTTATGLVADTVTDPAGSDS
jgi:hypothetical protein